MPRFDFDNFAEGGVIREKTLREAFDRIDWETYRDKSVHIQGCASVVIPTWAYLMAATRLALVARKITFGEDSNPMPIFLRGDLEDPGPGL